MPLSQDSTVELDSAGGARASGRRRPWIGAAVGGLLAAAIVAALLSGAFDDVPLLNVSVSAVIETLAATALIRSWSHPDRRWLRRALPALLLSVVVLCAGVALMLRITNTITDSYPVTFGLWVGMAVLALAGLPFTVRQGQPVRRVAGVLAVPLTLVGALMLIDQEYGVWPQVGDAFGRIPADVPAAVPADVTGGPSSTHAVPRTGELVAMDIPSTVSHFRHRRANVYLPPAYFTAARSTLPVLVMLAGSLGTPDHWPRAGQAVATENKYAAAHHGFAPVMLFADVNGSSTADTECVDGPQGKTETYLTTDVRNFAVNRLHLQPSPERWGVVGFSEGGTCALDLTLRHATIYRHIISLGGDDKPTFGDSAHTLTALFGGSLAEQNAHDPVRLMATHHFAGMTAWFTAGADDGRHVTIARQLATDAIRAGIRSHEFTGVSGHNWQFASAAFARILPQLVPELTTPSK
jgi:S-formylglutathione hydrolase FrmB